MSLDIMKKRMVFDGGDTSDGRNVRGKYLSFKSALNNSYQAEWITFNDKKWRCLINPDKITNDYDQKEISIDFKAEMKNGDVFYWDRTESYWIVFSQRLEEEAYFRAIIRQCQYQIDKWWVYLRGPVETSLVWNQKHDLYFNDMNYTILLYVPKNEETLEYFKRFQKIKFDGHNWRVAATDKYSVDGIIEVYLEEAQDNEMEDNMILPEIPKPDTSTLHIDGPQLVKGYDSNLVFTIDSEDNGKFIVNSDKVEIKEMTNTLCVLEILTGRSFSFVLSYIVEGKNPIELPIKVQSI